jgi:hypothetical protein
MIVGFRPLWSAEAKELKSTEQVSKSYMDRLFPNDFSTSPNDPNLQENLKTILAEIYEKPRADIDEEESEFYREILFDFTLDTTVKMSPTLQQWMKKLYFKLKPLETEEWCKDTFIWAAQAGNIPMLKFGLELGFSINCTIGESRDQADAEWIVIRTQLRGHNDTPFGRPNPSWPPGVWPPFGRILFVFVTIN